MESGVFGGYNIQRNNLVFGGEIAAQFGSLELENAANSEFINLIDAKARAGYAFGATMIYGFVGCSTGAWDNHNPAGISPDFGALLVRAGMSF